MKYWKYISVLILIVSCKNSVSETTNGEQTINSRIVDVALAGQSTLNRIVSFPSKYITPRPVDVWLPEHYSETKKYAVLYMHDGQMLFDSTSTWNKQEWKVDEHATQLMQDKKVKDFIVVAVHNISNIRFFEYYPKKTMAFLSQKSSDSLKAVQKKHDVRIPFTADNYLKFLTEELKPFIDTNYSVDVKREQTFIAGSSMGGLISMYAVCEYPEVFGGAACISTHWPGMEPSRTNHAVPNAIFEYMKVHVPSPKTHKFYFDFGTETLDQFYPYYEEAINTLFKNKGYTASNFKNLKFEGDDHSENSWNKRLDMPLTFLLQNPK